jgi:hypothetical protein
MVDLEITREELALVLVITIMGFAFSMRPWILFLDSLNPFTGLIVYYIILYITLYVLSKMGLVIWKIRIKTPLQVLGCLLITMAFFITVDWESPWVQYVTGRAGADVSNVLYQAEDGAFWYLWSFLISNFEVLRILTYVITPFILTLIGVILVKKAEIIGG